MTVETDHHSFAVRLAKQPLHRPLVADCIEAQFSTGHQQARDGEPGDNCPVVISWLNWRV